MSNRYRQCRRVWGEIVQWAEARIPKAGQTSRRGVNLGPPRGHRDGGSQPLGGGITLITVLLGPMSDPAEP